jgi:hypothetical protein
MVNDKETDEVKKEEEKYFFFFSLATTFTIQIFFRLLSAGGNELFWYRNERKKVRCRLYESASFLC